MRERKKDFYDYLCKRMDAITNAAHELIIALTGTDCSPVEWDMQKIGPITDCAEEILIAQGVYCCYPGYDEKFAQMKKDILDGVQPEEVSLRDDLTLEVRREQDNLLFALTENSAERDATGASVLTGEEFLSKSAQEISFFVNAVNAYNMIENEREDDFEYPLGKITIAGKEYGIWDKWENGEDSFVVTAEYNEENDTWLHYSIVNGDESTIQEYDDASPDRQYVQDLYYGIVREDLSLHIQYPESKEKDIIRFDIREAMDMYIRGEATWDADENSVQRENEVLLYAENRNGVVWESPEYQKQQKEAVLEKWTQLSEVGQLPTP